ncbi:MAG TPA: FliH/SctL family protein [Terracidiphilus sp.]|jgi:flagellar biosynthesis/type III secretory pathway protein FliH
MHHSDTTIVEVFEYPDSGKTPPRFWEDLSEVENPALQALTLSAAVAKTGMPQAKLKDHSGYGAKGESQSSFEAGRGQGIHEGREQEQAAQKTRLLDLEKEMERKCIGRAAKLTEQFAQKQGLFFETVEPEVVRLALAIAGRVLRREAQIDPLFLLGAVRVALGQLAQSMHVRLRVPVADAGFWNETISHIPNLKVRPEVVPDPALELGDCLIESEMGSGDLGLCAQLQTIQRTLLDDPLQMGNDAVPEPKLQNEEVRS